jgi:hypothetical protein
MLHNETQPLMFYLILLSPVYYLDMYSLQFVYFKNRTMKNFSQSFSKGNELGVKNMKAIF